MTGAPVDARHLRPIAAPAIAALLVVLLAIAPRATGAASEPCGTWQAPTVSDVRVEATDVRTSDTRCRGRWRLHNATDLMEGWLLPSGYSLELRTHAVRAQSTFDLPVDFLVPGLDLELIATPSQVAKPATATVDGNMTRLAFELDVTMRLIDELISVSPGLICEVPKRAILFAAVRTMVITAAAVEAVMHRGFAAGVGEFQARVDQFIASAAHAFEQSVNACVKKLAVRLAERLAGKALGRAAVAARLVAIWSITLTTMTVDHLQFGGRPSTVNVAYLPPQTVFRNRAYTTDCGGTADPPVTVPIVGGRGQAPASTDSNRRFEVLVQQVTSGDLTGDYSAETAVLLSCSPQPSNYFSPEVQVFTAGNRLLGRLPRLEHLPGGYPIDIFEPQKRFEIKDGALHTAMGFHTGDDCHACGPSVHRVVTWTWDADRRVFVAHGAPRPNPPPDLAAMPVTLDGIGPLRIGMSVQAAQAALGGEFEVEYPNRGDTCGIARPRGVPEGLMLMFILNELARIDVTPPAGIATLSGVRVGSTEADVKRTYASRIAVEPHEYDPGGHYLVFTPDDATDRLLLFETDGEVVTSYRVGTAEAARLVEFCV